MHLEHLLCTIPLKMRALFRHERVEQEPDEELPARGLCGKERTAPPGATSGVSNKARRSAGTCAG